MPIMVKQDDGSYLKVRLDSEPDEISTETVFLHIGGENNRDLREFRGDNIRGVKFGLRLWETNLTDPNDIETRDRNIFTQSPRTKIKQYTYTTFTNTQYNYASDTITISNPDNQTDDVRNSLMGFMVKVLNTSPPSYYIITANEAGCEEISIHDGPGSMSGPISIVYTAMESATVDRLLVGDPICFVTKTNTSHDGFDFTNSSMGEITFFDGIFTYPDNGVTLYNLNNNNPPPGGLEGGGAGGGGPVWQEAPIGDPEQMGSFTYTNDKLYSHFLHMGA